MASEIHPTAIVDPRAELGSDVVVGAYSIIGHNVTLGDRTWVGPHVVIDGNTRIGENNEIFQFASIGSKPQDLKFNNEPSTVEIGHNNKIREYVTIQPGTTSGILRTIVGNNNLFMVSSHVAHDCIVGNNNVIANSCALAGHVEIGNNIIIGGMAGIHQFCRIGDFAMIGAGSMVAQDIPPTCIGQGDRCHLRGINVIGLERNGVSTEDIAKVRKAYRVLFSKVGNISKKMEDLTDDLKSAELVQKIIAFIGTSSRGICPPAKVL